MEGCYTRRSARRITGLPGRRDQVTSPRRETTGYEPKARDNRLRAQGERHQVTSPRREATGYEPQTPSATATLCRTLSLTHTVNHCHSQPLSLSLSLTLSLSHCEPLSLSLSAAVHSLSLSLSRSLTHPPALSLRLANATSSSTREHTLLSHKVFLKSFCKSQSPHKPVNSFLHE